MNENISHEQKLQNIVTQWQNEINRISARLIELSNYPKNETFKKEEDRLKKQFQNVDDALKLANKILTEYLNSK